jgi:DNA-binding GntR family transcriptional regulator
MIRDEAQEIYNILARAIFAVGSPCEFVLNDAVMLVHLSEPPAETSSQTPAQTQASSVYERLRADLLTARLAPGRKLQLKFLMERYQTGQTPIREALNRLTSEGLVECQDQRGFSVAGISAAELAELTKTRCWVEDLALRQAMAAATPAWEEELVVACHRLVRTPRSLSSTRYEDNPEWERVHRAFHRCLLRPCDSRSLCGFCDQLTDQLYRYRQLSVRKVYPARDINTEHEAIARAVLDGDADHAASLLRQHYQMTADVILGDPSAFAASMA